MTLPMWLAWLLRADVRAGGAILDPAAQRDFVAWWLLFGQTEYPAVWSYGATQIRVAMEPVAVAPGVVLPRLLHRIWLGRGDLRDAYPLLDHEDAADLLCWYRVDAAVEYPAAPALEGRSLAATEDASRRAPWSRGCVPRLAVALWRRSPDLQRAIHPHSPDGPMRLADWYSRNAARLLPLPPPLPSPCDAVSAPRPGIVPRPGVNLVGFAHAETGLGEDVREMSRAMEAIGVDHVILDAGTPPGVRGADRSRDDRLAQRLVHPVTIFCLNAFDTCAAFLKYGPALFAAPRNIGYWPWELPVFPRIWVDATQLVDEIWAGTRFQQAAYRATCAIPVRLRPPHVDVSAAGCHRPAVIRRARRQLGGRARGRARIAYTFIFPFDPNSYLARKNPGAAIRAFRMAFPRADWAVSLILRVNGATPPTPAWRAVERAMGGDRRIRVMTGTLERNAALALLAGCDCLVSPHRAEGFGRNIAEAIALGTPVIATAFSGPADYLRGLERLPYRRRAVADGEYPFGEGLSWAEPAVRELARRMAWRRARALRRR